MIGPPNEIDVTLEEAGAPDACLTFQALSRRDLIFQLRVDLSFYDRIVIEYRWLADNKVAAVIAPERLN